MRTHRFFIKGDLRNKILRVDDRELINQWRNVLRLKSGDEIHVFDGTGIEAKTKILSFDKNTVELQILEIFTGASEASRHVVLYCSLLKKENFELVAQKATEIGIMEIVPIITDRTEKLNLRMDRLEKIVKEASEQSGRSVVPKLFEPISFKKAVTESENNKVNLLFDLSGESLEDLKTYSKDDGRIGVFVGPEGGWTDEEISFAEKAKFKKISLGKLTLRAETAAIIASYLTVNF